MSAVSDTVARAANATAIPDDEDEIVYPISSQPNSTSVSPDLAGDPRSALSTSGTGHTVKPVIEGQNNETSNNNIARIRNRNGRAKSNPFPDDFVLERGDAGSKVWMPPTSVQRPQPKGRGHRSTKSESSLPAAPASGGHSMTLEPVKESWADDMKGLEAQMARASLEGTPARPRSTPVANARPISQSPSSTPRKQRSQKKQKGNRQARGESTSVSRSTASNGNAPTQAYSSLTVTTPKPTSPNSGTADAANTRSPTKKPKKGKSRNRAKRESVPESVPSTVPSTPRGLGRRSVVDDVSENGDFILPPQSLIPSQSDADRLLGLAYDEAVKFMNAFIENPDYYSSRASRLMFLQALTVELGLVSASGPQRTLPESLGAAKALLKSHAFLNVKDYLALREKGLDALRSAMRPSRSALVRDLRGRNGRRAKLGWVKETGLNVLLVSCQY